MTRLLLAAVAGAALVGCAPMGGPMYGAPMPGMTMPTNAMDYGRMAAVSDTFEIQSSQTALQVSRNPEVRAFAQMMIDHHTMTSNELMAAARAAGMAPPPPMLDSRKQAMMAQLQSTPAARFDSTYMSMQMTAHQEALALHSAYAARGDVQPLRAVAARAVPIVRQHLDRATAMHHRMMGM